MDIKHHVYLSYLLPCFLSVDSVVNCVQCVYLSVQVHVCAHVHTCMHTCMHLEESLQTSVWAIIHKNCLIIINVIIIIMYIYHALINTLSAHMIHSNLNTIFCTHRAQSYQNSLHKVLFGNTHTHTVAKTGIDISLGGNTVRRRRYDLFS